MGALSVAFLACLDPVAKARFAANPEGEEKLGTGLRTWGKWDQQRGWVWAAWDIPAGTGRETISGRRCFHLS